LDGFGDVRQMGVARGEFGGTGRDPDDGASVEHLVPESLVAHPGAVQHPAAALRAEPCLAAATRLVTVGHVSTPVGSGVVRPAMGHWRARARGPYPVRQSLNDSMN